MLKSKWGILLFLAVLGGGSLGAAAIRAEDKNVPAGGMITKLAKTANDPELFNNFVYPMWGPVCQRYTYTVTYKDKEGRPPEYLRIIFNGQAIEMEKAQADDNDYKNGVRYEYKFVPKKLGSNFYYFEASNGLGKARASIIDSPDNGPVLFEGDFLDNEISVIDVKSGKKILSYPTKEEWIGGVAMSANGQYLAAKSSRHIYFFDTTKPDKPLWEFELGLDDMIGGDVKGGVAIAGDGSKIFAAIGDQVLLFDKKSNKPLWQKTAGNAYNVAISRDSQYVGAATAGEEANANSNLLIIWNVKSNKPLWQYHSSGNFHDIDFSQDGRFISGSTGCPDRRFYLFSRDSNEPIIRTEMLTRDSPVHRAKISADGNWAAVGTESDRGAVLLFSKDKSEPLWRFDVPGGSSVRALSFTPDGQYIGAASFGGSIYIFQRDSSQPLASWSLKGALGGVDISDDGQFIAAGGTDNKLHVLSSDKSVNLEIPFEEYVEEVDISANGQYAAAGTGGSVYFFESFSRENKVFDCAEVIEPKPLEETMPRQSAGPIVQRGWLRNLLNKISLFFSRIFKLKPAVDPGSCGNALCEPDFGETRENCPNDCSGGD